MKLMMNETVNIKTLINPFNQSIFSATETWCAGGAVAEASRIVRQLPRLVLSMSARRVIIVPLTYATRMYVFSHLDLA